MPDFIILLFSELTGSSVDNTLQWSPTIRNFLANCYNLFAPKSQMRVLGTFNGKYSRLLYMERNIAVEGRYTKTVRLVREPPKFNIVSIHDPTTDITLPESKGILTGQHA